MRSYRVCLLPWKNKFGRCYCSRPCYHDADLCRISAKEIEVRVLLVGRGASWHLLLRAQSPEAPLLAKLFLAGSNTHDEMEGGVAHMREHLLPLFAAFSHGRPSLSEWRQRDCSDLSVPHPLQIGSSHKMATVENWRPVNLISLSSGLYLQLAVDLKRHFCAVTQCSLVLVVAEAAMTGLFAPLRDCTAHLGTHLTLFYPDAVYCCGCWMMILALPRMFSAMYSFELHSCLVHFAGSKLDSSLCESPSSRWHHWTMD